jgi:hypothetical protein
MKVKIVQPIVQPDVSITMSLEEARLLRTLTGRIGGESYVQGRTRKYYDLAVSLSELLRTSNVEPSDTPMVLANVNDSYIEIVDGE